MIGSAAGTLCTLFVTAKMPAPVNYAPELARGEELVDPLLDVLDLHVKARANDTAL